MTLAPPTVGTVGQELYDDLEPLAYADAANDYALLTLAGAVGGMFQGVSDLCRATDDGPGWSQLLDVTRCPTAFLPYLAQFVGVTLTPGLTDAQWRAQIVAETGMARGTVGAITAAARKLLTGSQTVVVIERAGGDPYAFGVVTYTSETPDSDAVLAALTAAKPAGLVMTYSCVDGQIWAQLIANYATWQDVINAYPTWLDVINDTP